MIKKVHRPERDFRLVDAALVIAMWVLGFLASSYWKPVESDLKQSVMYMHF